MNADDIGRVVYVSIVNMYSQTPCKIVRFPGVHLSRIGQVVEDINPLALSAVVHENWYVSCHNMVRVVAACPCGEYVEVAVVVAGNGEVPHPAIVDPRGDAAVGGDDRAVSRLEQFALLELGRSDPPLQIRTPE